MKIEVDDVVTLQDGHHQVLVSTGAGRATLPLRTPVGQVVRGTTRTAELDVDVSLVRGKNAWSASERDYRIDSNAELVTLVGVIDGVDPDGLVYFRLGPDALIMIESAPEQFSPGEWLRVVVPVGLIGISLI